MRIGSSEIERFWFSDYGKTSFEFEKSFQFERKDSIRKDITLQL